MMPNMTVLAPKNDRELEEMLAFAVSFDGPDVYKRQELQYAGRRQAPSANVDPGDILPV